MFGKTFEKIREKVLPYVIRPLSAAKRNLSDRDARVVDTYVLLFGQPQNPPVRPLIIAMIGLVGSGKSGIARRLGKELKVPVVEADEIRVLLQQWNSPFDNVWFMTEMTVEGLLRRRHDAVIIDADFMDYRKRASIRKLAQDYRADICFIRAHCDYDVVASRIRQGDPGGFFSAASTKSLAADSGKDVKLRDLWRRTPLHYEWRNRAGGEWVLRDLPFVLPEIDTGNAKTFEGSMEFIKNDLLKAYWKSQSTLWT